MEKIIFTNIDDVVDGLGKGIDEGIKATVWHINRLGIQTIQSCEGHIEKSYSHFWVDFFEKDYDKSLAIIYDFNKENPNICIDRRMYYHPDEKMMCCRLMPIDRKEDQKTYDRNKELLKTFEKYLINKNG